SKLGWVLFIALALGSVLIAEHVRWIRRKTPEPEAPASKGRVPQEAAAYVTPLLTTLVTALISGMLAADGVELAYGLRLIASAAALLALRSSLPTPVLSLDLRAIGAGLVVGVVWILVTSGEPTA